MMRGVISITTATLLDGLTFGEAPRWHDGRLWYSDFFSHNVFSVQADGTGLRREMTVPGQPSGLGWLPDGRLLCVSMRDHAVVRREPTGEVSLHASLEPWVSFHANDMVVDASGRAYVGNFGFDLEAFLAGEGAVCDTALVRVDADGSVHVAAEHLTFPNGMALAADGRTLVVAETFASRLSAFDVHPDGSLTGARVWAPLERCAPDGICGDAKGALWVANARAPECRRVAEGGATLTVVETSQPCFACALGGDDRRTLFCMTAPTSEPRKLAGRRLGLIEVARVSVPGAGTP